MALGDLVMQAILSENNLPFETLNLEAQSVSEGMKGRFEDSLNPTKRAVGKCPEPIMIVSPHDTGKARFVINDLSKLAKENQLCNVIFVDGDALHREFIKIGQPNDQDCDSSRSQDKKRADEDTTIFISYQQFTGDLNSLMLSLKLPDPNRVGCVVLYDIHFFAANAAFDHRTSDILRNILRYSRGIQRIYMTSDSDDVENIIAYEERADICQARNAYFEELLTSPYISAEQQEKQLEEFSSAQPERIIKYAFPKKPTKANVRFFSQWDIVEAEINRTKSKHKWFVFTETTENAYELKSALKDSVVLPADVTLADRQVLIGTSVTEYEYTAYSEDIHSIVIDMADPERLLRMIDKKRLPNSERVNVYIRTKSEEDIRSYADVMKRKIDAVSRFERDPNGFLSEEYDRCDIDTRRMFCFDRFQGRRFVNDYLKYCLTKKYREYIRLSNEMIHDKNAYAKKICQKLGLEFGEDLVMSDDALSVAWAHMQDILYVHAVLPPFDREELIRIRGEMIEIIKGFKHGTGIRTSDRPEKAMDSVNSILGFFASKGFEKYIVDKKDGRYSFYCFDCFDRR